MISDIYKTIRSESKGIFKDRGSRFLAFAYPISTEEEIKSHLQQLKKEYHDARHHCYAYRICPENELYRFNDDGEPSGTAGKPIYGQIVSHELTNILIIVVRYFGGTLLGTSGLTNAYRNAAKDCLSNAKIINQMIQHRMQVYFRYEDMNIVMRILKEEAVTIHEQLFDTECKLKLSVRKSRVLILSDRLNKLDHMKLIAD